MRRHFFLALLAFFSFASAHADTSDLEEHLRDQYQDKKLLLRGFYSGDRLKYDASGTVTEAGSSGDWTRDGLVRVKEMKISGHTLSIWVDRLFISGQEQFHILANKRRKPQKFDSLKIEADLGLGDLAQLQVDAAMSKIFLTSQDNLDEQVPDYWKPCIRGGLSKPQSSCHFETELLSVPGISLSESGRRSPATNESPQHPEYRTGGRVTPPRQIFATEPDFEAAARAMKCQGTVMLGLIVNEKGQPANIHVLDPVGCGLDAKAVQAVNHWRFEPARNHGQAISVEITVELDFHLY